MSRMIHTREPIKTLHTSTYNEVVIRENEAYVAGFRLAVEAVRHIDPKIAEQIEAEWLAQSPAVTPKGA